MKRKEYGSNFCEELEVSDLILRDSDKCFFFDSGRSALRYLLNQVETNIARVLLPEYTCQSVISPFWERKYRIGYYPVNKKFEVEKEVFKNIVERERPDLIFVQTYFGIDSFAKIRLYLEELQKKGVLIVEDITHSLFSEYIYRWGHSDYIMGSLRKWSSIPDGGILVIEKPMAKNKLKHVALEENTKYVQKRLEAQRSKRQYFKLTNEHIRPEKKRFIELYHRSEEILDLQKKYYTMSQYTRKRIGSIDRMKLVKSRQENYLQLRYALEKIPKIEVIDLKIENNTVPLYCPIYIHGNFRDEFRLDLQKQNIFLPVIWPRPYMLEDNLDEEVEWIYSHILAVPCDQRYGYDEIREIIDGIECWMKEYGLCF